MWQNCSRRRNFHPIWAYLVPIDRYWVCLSGRRPLKSIRSKLTEKFDVYSFRVRNCPYLDTWFVYIIKTIRNCGSVRAPAMANKLPHVQSVGKSYFRIFWMRGIRIVSQLNEGRKERRIKRCGIDSFIGKIDCGWGFYVVGIYPSNSMNRQKQAEWKWKQVETKVETAEGQMDSDIISILQVFQGP